MINNLPYTSCGILFDKYFSVHILLLVIGTNMKMIDLYRSNQHHTLLKIRFHFFLCDCKLGNFMWILLAMYDLIIASLSRQEHQSAGTAKWPTTLRFGKILGTTSVVRSIENP